MLNEVVAQIKKQMKMIDSEYTNMLPVKRDEIKELLIMSYIRQATERIEHKPLGDFVVKLINKVDRI